MPYCRNCGNSTTSTAVGCVHCGIPLGLGHHFCQNCGASTEDYAAFCIRCGVALTTAAAATTAQVPAAKSKVAAGVLGILLGTLGVHNFYLGYIGKGIAQLLITVLSCGMLSLFSGIWGLVEGILILTGTIATDASGVPLHD